MLFSAPGFRPIGERRGAQLLNEQIQPFRSREADLLGVPFPYSVFILSLRMVACLQTCCVVEPSELVKSRNLEFLYPFVTSPAATETHFLN